jgi:prepilin-type processing-associated H-X9-DG protein
MDETLLGYLLNGLEPEEHQEVVAHLLRHPEKRQRLEQLRRCLDFLGADDADIDPPPGLWIRTLAAVAEYKCRSLPLAPRSSSEAGGAAGRTWWRRVDILVAAGLLLVVSGLTVTGLNGLWNRYRIQGCQDNLQRLHPPLVTYSEVHGGRFPWVNSNPPKHLAGYYAPILNDSGLLPSEYILACPGQGLRAPVPRSVNQLEELRRTQPEKFHEVARTLGGSYAYSLGFFEMGEGLPVHRGLTSNMEGRSPIMSDLPPPLDFPGFATSNSLNHGGSGQNVLFIDGHVQFFTNRRAGLNGDDIFVNLGNRIEAGKNPQDTVLGASDASPNPGQDK